MKIAVVEDEREYREVLKEYLSRYEEQKNLTFEVIEFTNAISFLENYAPVYDVVFMDIRMKYMDGMTAAHKLREADPNAVLVFVTSLTQYAVEGYSVDATDYIVKPVSYYDFALKFTRALKRLPPPSIKTVILPSKTGMRRVALSDVIYCETSGHNVIFHTSDGDFQKYSSLSAVERELKALGFCKCNSCYLVNLKFVKEITGYSVKVGDAELQISQPRKKALLAAVKNYAGNGNV